MNEKKYDNQNKKGISLDINNKYNQYKSLDRQNRKINVKDNKKIVHLIRFFAKIFN